jgi:acyl transferase domain-containing protein
MKRVIVVCPGRGSYGVTDLGSLANMPATIRDVIDRRRDADGLVPLATLDSSVTFENRHLAGPNAADLTFARSMSDLAAVDRQKVEIACVVGNSMGWYTALVVAGALDLEAGTRLVGTLAALQTDRVGGAQAVYPLVDDSWKPDPTLEASVAKALETPRVFVSIRLGGSIVLGYDEELRPAQLVPNVRRGGTNYPLALPGHQAFHTPFVAPIVDHARAALADLPFASPEITLVGGDARIHRPKVADPVDLRDYTFGPQLVEPFDFESCLETAVGNFAPDALLLLGPGETLGGSCGQILVAMGWRGLRDRKDFVDAQAGDAPLVIAMARPAQRALVATA